MRRQKTQKQCKACPWRVGVVPDRDIPNGYDVAKHANLRGAIDQRLSATLRVMSCHESAVRRPFACAGWVHNQNEHSNLAVRMAIFEGRLPIPDVDGPQHEHFDDTLPARE